MKFRGHETFPIRRGWLTKGIIEVNNNEALFITKDPNPTLVLGIGINMVRSLRYWLQATGITNEVKSEKIKRRKVQKLSDIGELILKNDPYFEDFGTLLIIHYYLASNSELATSWYYFFNYFDFNEFNRNDFVLSINDYIMQNEPTKSISSNSLEGDFNCLINTYKLNRRKELNKFDPEDNLICPLTELELIQELPSKNKQVLFKKKSIDVNRIDPLIAMFILKSTFGNQSEITFSDLLNKPNSIGKILNLSNTSLLQLLRKLEDQNEIKVDRTAGLDIIRILNDKKPIEYLNKYYELS